MVKKEKIEKGGNSFAIDLEYDVDKYNMEYVKEAGKIILRRLSDNKVIQIFDDNIGFIVQVDKDEDTHFLVSSFLEKEYKCFLTHYVDYTYEDFLSVSKKFDCDYITLEELRLTESSFIVGLEREGRRIYNLKETTKNFKTIFNDNNVKQYFDDNTILVTEKKYADANYRIMDIITYGINPETFEITTPIWSELQQRSIPIYTEEQLDEIEIREENKGYIINRKNYNAGYLTIYFEIERELNIIGDYFGKPESVYKDIWNEVNEDFVRSFIKKDNR